MGTTLGICFLHIFPQRPELERENREQRTVSFTRDLAGCHGQNLLCSCSTVPALPGVKDLTVPTGFAVGVTKIGDLAKADSGVL